METQQALVKTEPDAIALVVHDGTGSNDCELQSSTSDPWSSISIAGCGDASIPASTVFENDVKTLVVMPSGTEDIVQTLAFQTLENSAAVSSGSIPLNILHSEPVSIDAVGESGIQIPVDCSASGASIKLEPVDPGYEETYPDTVQAPDISIVKTEDDSAIPTGLYKNVYIKPEPAGSSESSAATVSSAAAQEPVATTSVGNLESPLEVADRSFQRVKRCSVRLKRLPDGLLSRGIFRVPRVQGSNVTAPRKSNWLKRPSSQTDTSRARTEGSTASHAMKHPSVPVKTASCFNGETFRKRSKTGKRPFVCDECGKAYKTASARSQHRKVHIGLKEHKCNVCNKSFMYKSTLTTHQRTHSGERPYPCTECSASFRWSSHLKTHMLIHQGSRPYECYTCGMAFTQKGNLQKHVQLHFGVKSIICDYCGRAFHTQGQLVSHERTHTGAKPFKCDVCDAVFSQSSTLTIHKRTHTGEKPYICDYCDAPFRQLPHLKWHLNHYHKTTKSADGTTKPRYHSRRKVSERNAEKN